LALPRFSPERERNWAKTTHIEDPPPAQDPPPTPPYGGRGEASGGKSQLMHVGGAIGGPSFLTAKKDM